jgi:hypothetical protein
MRSGKIISREKFAQSPVVHARVIRVCEWAGSPSLPASACPVSCGNGQLHPSASGTFAARSRRRNSLAGRPDAVSAALSRKQLESPSHTWVDLLRRGAARMERLGMDRATFADWLDRFRRISHPRRRLDCSGRPRRAPDFAGRFEWAPALDDSQLCLDRGGDHATYVLACGVRFSLAVFDWLPGHRVALLGTQPDCGRDIPPFRANAFADGSAGRPGWRHRATSLAARTLLFAVACSARPSSKTKRPGRNTLSGPQFCSLRNVTVWLTPVRRRA